MDVTTETETPTNGNGRGPRAKPTSQQPIPGTEPKASAKLKALHEEYATAKYEAKACQELMQELSPKILELMREEKLDSLGAEIDVGDTVRRCVTTIKTSEKLKTKLEKENDE
jgi:hypothetical protein